MLVEPERRARSPHVRRNLNPQPSTLNPHPSTLNPQPSTLNPQPSTLKVGLGAEEMWHSSAEETLIVLEVQRKRQPTGPNPLYHRDDLVDRPRAMGV